MKSHIERALIACLLWCLTTGWIQAQAHENMPPVERFDQQTWAQSLKSGPRPAAYVFTTTYCSTCPDAFEQLRQATHLPSLQSKRSVKPHLAVVIMDWHSGKASAHAHHFASASRLYFFDGPETAIRYSIDPQWRNITPYIVLVNAAGKIQRSTGAPESAMLRAWLNPSTNLN